MTRRCRPLWRRSRGSARLHHPGSAHSGQCHFAQNPCLLQWAAGKGFLLGEGRCVVIDVCYDHTPFKQIYPALQWPYHGHLKVQETLVFIKYHLALWKLLSVNTPWACCQLTCDIPATSTCREAQVCGHVPNLYVRWALLCYPVPES
uniref:Uncharacterized protein n=1 Tax=Seriola lalandi dorsalis TaxID=1841481 RepID=A0A3B4YVB2_SERLL